MKSIAIGTSYAEYSDPRRIASQKLALSYLNRHPQNISAYVFDFIGKDAQIEYDNLNYSPSLERNSAYTIGNTRELPYIFDILYKLSWETDADVIGYINSDIIIGNPGYEILQDNYDAFIFSRRDIAEVTLDDALEDRFKVIYGGDTHAGADGFFFDRIWWMKNCHLFPPDLIIGETDWDTVYRCILYKKSEYIVRRCLYHIYHRAKWDKVSPGAKNNLKILEEFGRGDTY